MGEKERVLLELLNEIHNICTKNDILYYLAEDVKDVYSLTVRMDSDNMSKFLKAYPGNTEHRALEWMGVNYRYVGTQLKYINLDTLYYTEDRLLSEIYLGMYIRIETLKPSTSKLAQMERYWRYLHYTDKDKRSNLLNSIAAGVHAQEIKKAGGKLKKKDVIEVKADDFSCYVRANSRLLAAASGNDAASGAQDKNALAECICAMIKKKPNGENFVCDESISYRDIDFTEEKRILKDVNEKFRKSRLSLKKAESMRSILVDVSRASFYRYYYATELLARYSYEEMKSCEDGSEIKALLSEYLADAKKYRKKGQSIYIGDSFTEVIKAVFPKENTDDLYAKTPDVYYEGVKVYDYKGELIQIYGGRNE